MRRQDKETFTILAHIHVIFVQSLIPSHDVVSSESTSPSKIVKAPAREPEDRQKITSG